VSGRFRAISQTSNFILPCELEYTEHREVEKRRKETRESAAQARTRIALDGLGLEFGHAVVITTTTSPSIRQDRILSAFTASKISVDSAFRPSDRWLVAPRLGWPVVDAA
jgi:hypothetical protein